MPREGRPFWWPRCWSCARWLSVDRIRLYEWLGDPPRCERCARRTSSQPQSEETSYAR